MKPHVFMAFLGLSATLWAQARPGIDDLIRGVEGAANKIPTLEEVFMDVGRLVRSVDPKDLVTLQARLKETEDQLRLLESLKGTLERGVMVELPAELLQSGATEATPEALVEARTSLQELQKEVLLQRARKNRLTVAKVQDRRAAGTSSLGKAMLGVSIDLEMPPTSSHGTHDAAVAAIDPAGLGKARYLAGDFVGAINALLVVPEGERTPEMKYRLARAQDRLGRWKEAKASYEALSQGDPSGFWGGQARWMLRFGSHKESVREALGSEKESGVKKETP